MNTHGGTGLNRRRRRGQPGRGASVFGVGLVAALLLLTPSDGQSQQPTRSPESDQFRRLLDRSGPESNWRIQTAEGRYEGRVGIREGSWLQFDGSPRIEYDEVERAWRRERASGVGAKWGALTLGVVGAILIGYDCHTEGAELDCNVPVVTAVGGAVGAVGGFLVGLGVGSLFHHWQLRYP